MFELLFTESALKDLRFFRRNEQSIILAAIEQQLLGQPLTQTRNRKPLRPNDLSTWEVRVGSHRVFYDVNQEDNTVIIKAVGRKERNKLFIRGEEHHL
jgi:mRNA-degrading endonuclease RelE of RelBE toxin-antitoxin system